MIKDEGKESWVRSRKILKIERKEKNKIKKSMMGKRSKS